MNENTTKNSARLLYLDLLRILGCFLVIVNHTMRHVYLSQPAANGLWFSSITAVFVSKPAVPLFLMISGITLLSKSDSPLKSLIRIVRIAIVLFLFSIPYAFTYWEKTFSIFHYIQQVLLYPCTNAYWYLYVYLGLLVTLPLLQALVSVMKREHFLYFFLVTFGFRYLFPIIERYLPIYLDLTTSFPMPFFNSYIGMMLLGFYLHRYHPVPSKKSVVLSVLILIGYLFISVVLTYGAYLQDPTDYLFLDNRELTHIVLASAAVFVIVQYVFTHCRIPGWIKRVIARIAPCTFGMYLLSDLLLVIAKHPLQTTVHSLHPIFWVTFLDVAVFAVLFVVVAVLRKIPYLRSLI